VLGLGAVFGYLIGDWWGLAFASVCLIVGLMLVVASEARGLAPKRADTKANSADRTRARVLVQVGEPHAVPYRDGIFQETDDLNRTDLELNVFINCWLLNETNLSVRIDDLQLTLKTADGSLRIAERVAGDLKNWGLIKVEKVEGPNVYEVESASQWELDLANEKVRRTRAGIVELDTSSPLECGVPREGWLHFRMLNTTPSEFKTRPLELSVKDSFSHTHAAVVGGVRHLPGSVWPIPAASPSVAKGTGGSSAA